MNREAIAARLRAAGCVWAEDEADVLLDAAPDPAVLRSWVLRRADGEPLEYVVGFADFAGVRVRVAPGVFVPRRRTELMIDVASRLPLGPSPVVADLGCGTGALGVALLARLGGSARLHAVDLDPVAVACARANLLSEARTYQGDLFDPLPTSLRGHLDVVLANGPYVPSGEIALLPAEAREHEHRSALDGGADGLDVHRRIAGAVAGWLRPGGTLLIEVSDRQQQTACELLAGAGLHVESHTDPDLGALVLTGTRPSRHSVVAG